MSTDALPPAAVAARAPSSGAGGAAGEVPWHGANVDEVARRLAVDQATGLSTAEAASRLQSGGANRLAGPAPRSPWWLLLSQFKSVLILILIGAAALAALIGNVRDAAVILAVVVINAIVGFYQEYRAERSLAALSKMLPQKSHARRDGQKLELDPETLVRGDLVLLEAGDRVPADGRLVLAVNLDIDESTLTGESVPSHKQVDSLPTPDLPDVPDVPIGDRLNMAYMNTLVTRGRAEMLVTATGLHTEMGSLSQQLAATPQVPSPLQLQIDQLGKRLGAVAVGLVSLLFAMQMLRGADLAHAVLASIALAIAAVPEGLPVVVTVTLALGMRRMAQQRAVVKRLSSVETLGCTTVICSDKTGTLTLNQMTARTFHFRGRNFDVSGEGYGGAGEIQAQGDESALPDLVSLLSPLLLPLVACNDSRIDDGRAIGDPTEAALLALAAKGGLDRDAALAACPRIAEIPFDSAHKFMATFHRDGEHIRLFVKGAPDVLLARCTRWLDAEGEAPLDTGQVDTINAEYQAMAARGLRGLLIASRTIEATAFNAQSDPAPWIHELNFVGLIGLMDPPRPEARQAIAECQAAGIAVKMITGDHRDTGVAIARELGLQGNALTGAELDRMDAHALSASIDGTAVFARVTPQHKVIIVQALQAKSHVVAMTGDGVNDAPALKAADIGIAMGVGGTEVARSAATMVLTDDNFATIVAAIKQGRVLYDNILKFIRFQLSTTVGAILTVFVASLLGLPEPFTPIQILWVAMIMDGPPAVALALDAGRAGIMNDAPRRRSEPVLPWSRLGRVTSFGLVMMLGTLGVLQYALHNGQEASALTLGFTTFVLFQFFNVFNARVEYGSTLTRGFFSNRMLWLSLAAVIGMQTLAVHWQPAQTVFGTTDLSVGQWAMAVGVASSVLILEELRKAVQRLFSKQGSVSKAALPAGQA